MKTCTYCSSPILFRCKPHRQYLCGDPKCIRLHSWDDKETCCFVAPDTGFDFLLYGLAALTVGVIAMAVYVHFGGGL